MTGMMSKLRSMKIHIPIHAPDCLDGLRSGRREKATYRRGSPPGRGDRSVNQSINRTRWQRGL